MPTPLPTPVDPDGAGSETPDRQSSPARTSRHRDHGPGRRLTVWVAVLIGLVGLATILIVASASDDGSPATGDPLVLTMADEAAASCLPFDVQTLATMSHAFAGTVTAVGDDTMTVAVDRWYAGGDTSIVELRTTHDAQALLGGFPVDVGAAYLLSAQQDAVSYCGYSGPATPELQQAFDTAFGGRS